MTMISESGVVVKSHTKRKRSETTWGFWSFAVRLANDAGGGGIGLGNECTRNIHSIDSRPRMTMITREYSKIHTK